jgi:transcriptional regulator with XRE-family HTH domain
MSEVAAVIRNLKSHMRAERVTYKELARRVGVSEPTVKRDLSRGVFSLSRLEEYCEAVSVTLATLLRPPSRASLLTELSAELEEALITNPKLLLTTYLIVNDWKFSEIVATYRITESELINTLLRLEKLGIIEFRPPQRVRKLTARNFSWRKDGPVHQFFLRRIVPEFFASAFDAPTDDLRLINGLLSQDSLRQFRASIERMAAEFEQLAHSDARLPLADRDGCSVILALRQWEFSEFVRLRRMPKRK